MLAYLQQPSDNFISRDIFFCFKILQIFFYIRKCCNAVDKVLLSSLEKLERPHLNNIYSNVLDAIFDL